MKLKQLMFNDVKSKWHTQILLFENNLAKLLMKENKQYVIGASDVPLPQGWTRDPSLSSKT